MRKISVIDTVLFCPFNSTPSPDEETVCMTTYPMPLDNHPNPSSIWSEKSVLTMFEFGFEF